MSFAIMFGCKQLKVIVLLPALFFINVLILIDLKNYLLKNDKPKIKKKSIATEIKAGHINRKQI